MRKLKLYIILGTLFLGFQNHLNAQDISISSSGGPSASNIPELLTVNLYNSSTSSITGYLSFEIKSNNTLVVSGTSSNITVDAQTTTAINLINAESILLPINYTYIEGSVTSIVNNGNNLPDGNYSICVEFMVNSIPVSSPTFCNYKFIGTNSTGGNLVLITPFDNSETPTNTPLFTWVGLGNDILYEFKLTEVLPYQISIPDISINNAPLHLADGLTSFNYLYSSFTNAPNLEDCKYYEWRVIAYEETFIPGEGGGTTSRTDIATSEVFRFGTNCVNEALRMGNTDIVYMTLSKRVNTYPYILNNNGPIPFKYDEKYNIDSVNVEIFNLSNGSEELINSDSTRILKEIHSGYNYISSITSENLTEGDGYYLNDVLLLKVTNAKGEVWKAKFKIQ